MKFLMNNFVPKKYIFDEKSIFCKDNLKSFLHIMIESVELDGKVRPVLSFLNNSSKEKSFNEIEMFEVLFDEEIKELIESVVEEQDRLIKTSLKVKNKDLTNRLKEFIKELEEFYNNLNN